MRMYFGNPYKYLTLRKTLAHGNSQTNSHLMQLPAFNPPLSRIKRRRNGENSDPTLHEIPSCVKPTEQAVRGKL